MMATATCRISFATRRSRATRGFLFAIGPGAGWMARLGVTSIVIAAFVLGIISIAILMGVLVPVALAFAIRRWWLRFRARDTANAVGSLETAPAHLLPPREIAPRLNGPMDSPQ